MKEKSKAKILPEVFTRLKIGREIFMHVAKNTNIFFLSGYEYKERLAIDEVIKELEIGEGSYTNNEDSHTFIIENNPNEAFLFSNVVSYVHDQFYLLDGFFKTKDESRFLSWSLIAIELSKISNTNAETVSNLVFPRNIQPNFFEKVSNLFQGLPAKGYEIKLDESNPTYFHYKAGNDVQTFQIFPNTVDGYVIVGKRKETPKKAERKLKTGLMELFPRLNN